MSNSVAQDLEEMHDFVVGVDVQLVMASGARALRLALDALSLIAIQADAFRRAAESELEPGWARAWGTVAKLCRDTLAEMEGARPPLEKK